MIPAASSSCQITAILQCLGADAAKYAENKHRGGSNGKKGTRYEDFFLAKKTAQIAVQYAQMPTKWPLLRGQAIEFVDDVTISYADRTEYYQLKNAASVSWTSGKHPIATDFSYQIILAGHLVEPNPKTVLVVSDENICIELGQGVPAEIAPHTTVEFFPYCDGHFNRLVLESGELRDLLRPLSKLEDPSNDELVGVFGVLILGCLAHPDGASVDAILRAANSFCPNMLGSLDMAKARQFIRDDFVNTLAAIPGLAYAFNKGFFSWTAFGTSGVFDVDCSSEQFAQFQDTVVQQQPTTFDDFEGLVP